MIDSFGDVSIGVLIRHSRGHAYVGLELMRALPSSRKKNSFGGLEVISIYAYS